VTRLENDFKPSRHNKRADITAGREQRPNDSELVASASEFPDTHDDFDRSDAKAEMCRLT
jgi:hypothetical protein